MNDIKLCKDCKHYIPEYNRCNYCRANNIGIIDMITGEFSPLWIYCSTHREDSWIYARFNKTCGKEGRFWEAKS